MKYILILIFFFFLIRAKKYNPLNITDRIAMIGDVLTFTNKTEFGKVNHLTGFLYQTKWLIKTGRIIDGNETSWWNSMNFFLITSQYLAAKEVKI